MVRPAIITPCDPGSHNEDLAASAERVQKAKHYQNLSTAILIPTRGAIPALVVQSWFYLYTASNNAVARYFSQGMEVSDAYNSGITTVVRDPNIKDFKYLLTMEDDNLPPHDGLLKLYENICGCPEPCREHFTVVGGLYWTKGEDGQPMIFGNPEEEGFSMRPQPPQLDSIQECNGVPMGFTLFHMGLFKDPALGSVDDPWFATVQVLEDNAFKAFTQDLYFMKRIREAGYRIACDTRVKVGHLDNETGMVW